MIRKFAYNRIFRTTGMLLLFLLILLFPASKEYTLEDTTKKTSYSNQQREVYLIDKTSLSVKIISIKIFFIIQVIKVENIIEI